MTNLPAVTDEMLDLFENAEANHTFTHGGDYRRCCSRAGLEALAPLIAADAVRLVEKAVTEQAAELRANYRTGNVPIEYINGMEDAAGGISQALTEIETMLAERGAR